MSDYYPNYYKYNILELIIIIIQLYYKLIYSRLPVTDFGITNVRD